jgi:hypothetical protein
LIISNSLKNTSLASSSVKATDFRASRSDMIAKALWITLTSFRSKDASTLLSLRFWT